MPKILIVDDQSAVRTALEVLFQVHGLETLAASTPAQALSLVASEDVGVEERHARGDHFRALGFT